MTIVTIAKNEGEKILRKKTADFDFKKYSKKEINALIKEMRGAMREAQGIGLSANQIGLNIKMFVAKANNKFYAVFNPEIIAASKETALSDEGCLSVPGSYGPTERPDKIILKGFDKSGKRIKIKAWGLLARVFQHEVDHLNGILFIDKAKEIKRAETKP